MTPARRDTQIARTGDGSIATDAPWGADDGRQGAIRVIRRLVWINLGLGALQASSAGFCLSGYSRAAGVHRVVAHALQFGALAQAVTAVVLWRKRRVPARLAGVGIG